MIHGSRLFITLQSTTGKRVSTPVLRSHTIVMWAHFFIFCCDQYFRKFLEILYKPYVGLRKSTLDPNWMKKSEKIAQLEDSVQCCPGVYYWFSANKKCFRNIFCENQVKTALYKTSQKQISRDCAAKVYHLRKSFSDRFYRKVEIHIFHQKKNWSKKLFFLGEKWFWNFDISHLLVNFPKS